MYKVFCDVTARLQESVLYVIGSKTQLDLTPLWSSALASCSIDNKFPLQLTCITIIFMFTTLKTEGYYNTCLKCPPSKCMHVDSHVFKSCQCMHPNLLIIIIIIRYVCLLSQAFLPGTSLEPAVIPTTQASSFTLQYFPYYVWSSKYSCLL